jgi:hypothetical protein
MSDGSAEPAVSDRFVTFNVGGAIFLVHVSTLRKHTDGASTFLLALLDPIWGEQKDHEGQDLVIRIDRNPDLFRVIIEFLRYDRWRIPASVPDFDLFDEIQFYGYTVPRCSRTLRWYAHRQSSALVRSRLTALGPAMQQSLMRLVESVFASENGVLLLPTANMVEEHLAPLGLPGLKVKVSNLLAAPEVYERKAGDHGALVSGRKQQTLFAERAPVIDVALFRILQQKQNADLVTFLADGKFFGSRVRLRYLGISVALQHNIPQCWSSPPVPFPNTPSAGFDYSLTFVPLQLNVSSPPSPQALATADAPIELQRQGPTTVSGVEISPIVDDGVQQ